MNYPDLLPRRGPRERSSLIIITRRRSRLEPRLNNAGRVASADTETPQLNAYAEDTATVLANEPPRHAGETRLSEVTRLADAFNREREALATRVDRILAENLYRVETPHGAVGYERPADAPTGQATVPTPHGEVTIWVWYV